MSKARAAGWALLAIGSALAGASVFLRWGVLEPLVLGHILVIYRSYRGWELAEGVVVWTMALVALFAVGAQLFRPSLTAKRLWRVAALAAALITIAFSIWLELRLEERITSDMASTYLGAAQDETARRGFEVLVKEGGQITHRHGYLLAAVGGALMLIGTLLSNVGLRRDPSGDEPRLRCD